MESSCLVARSGPFLCAFPIASVVEVLPCVPWHALTGMPPAVLGVSGVRGMTLPVLDLARVLGGEAAVHCGRFVHLRTAGSPLLAAVEEVRGVRALAETGASPPSETRPAWLRESAEGAVRTIQRLDGEMLLVLEPGKLLAARAWSGLGGRVA
jgi:purine-binding chemotaxis protein CheW